MRPLAARCRLFWHRFLLYCLPGLSRVWYRCRIYEVLGRVGRMARNVGSRTRYDRESSSWSFLAGPRPHLRHCIRYVLVLIALRDDRDAVASGHWLSVWQIAFLASLLNF